MTPHTHTPHLCRRNLWTHLVVLLALAVAIATACQPKHTPKPRGYFRVDMPKQHLYHEYAPVGFPYNFEVPAYAQVLPYTDKGAEPYWVNIYLAPYNANLHISYKRVQGNLPQIIEDVHYLVYKHAIKADDIIVTPFVSHDGRTHGLLYEIPGNAASNLQFYLTDDKEHFLRGALYFNNQPNYDSLAPIIRFFTEDVRHMMQSTEWR